MMNFDITFLHFYIAFFNGKKNTTFNIKGSHSADKIY